MAKNPRPGKPESDSLQESAPGKKKQSPEKWNTPKDARTYKNAGVYPNYTIQKGVCGDVWMVDRTMNHESLTIQSPDGSGFQFKPDGSVVMTAHNGSYQVVFGENRMLVTGAMDMTVRGGGSVRVEGDYNVSVMGDTNMTTAGNFNVVAKNMNVAAAKQFNMASESSTMKTAKSMTMQSSEGGMNMSASKGVSITSKQGDVSIGAGGGSLSLGAAEQIAIQSKGNVNIKSDGGTINNEASAINKNTPNTTKGIPSVEGFKSVPPAIDDSMPAADSNIPMS